LSDPLNLVGTTIAEKYAVESVVGEGGFAIVYKATHLIWKRPVAIKAFKSMGTFAVKDRERLLDEFVREGALLAELSERSAAICQARDVGTLMTPTGAWAPYMVLEWLEGVTLEKALLDERTAGMPPRTARQALEILEPVGEALALAHGRGIAHRDVKPGNIFLLGDPRSEACAVKLLDFGIAKVVQDAQKMAGAFSQTTGQVTSFTPAYGAPEQFSRAQGATGPWTDVFALGLIFSELVSGKDPLAGDDVAQLAFASMDPSRRPTPRALGAEVGNAVEAVIAKAVAVPTQERYQTVGELWNALRAASGLAPMRAITSNGLVESRPTSSDGPAVGSAASPAEAATVLLANAARTTGGQAKPSRAGITNEWPKITDDERKAFDPLCNARDPEGKGNHPVNCVDWDMASTFCQAATPRGRLPTEAEWEFATRGSDGRKFPWGDEWPDAKHLNACDKDCVAWGKKNRVEEKSMYESSDGFANTAPVGSFPLGDSPFGLSDVVGNVWEWTADWYAPYASAAETNPKGPEAEVDGDGRVIRGGAWNGAYPAWVRPTFRYHDSPEKRSYGIGFRCAADLESP